jgi:hypothetical protein
MNYLKISYFFAILLLLYTNTFAQEWQWAKGISGNKFDLYNRGKSRIKIATDQQGNVYTAFTVIDSIQVGNQKLKASGKRNAFIVKYKTDGSLVSYSL